MIKATGEINPLLAPVWKAIDEYAKVYASGSPSLRIHRSAQIDEALSALIDAVTPTPLAVSVNQALDEMKTLVARMEKAAVADKEASAEKKAVDQEKEPFEPLAESTTVVHPDQGDGPYVTPARMAVPRAKAGETVRCLIVNFDTVL